VSPRYKSGLDFFNLDTLNPEETGETF